MSYPYHGEDFCLIHGREHMRSTMGNPIAWCEACEEERAANEDDIVVYLRNIPGGEDDCWVVCAKGDPGAVAFTAPFQQPLKTARGVKK